MQYFNWPLNNPEDFPQPPKWAIVCTLICTVTKQGITGDIQLNVH